MICVGIRTSGEDLDGVAVGQGRAYAGEDQFLLRRELITVHRATIRMCTRVRFDILRLFSVVDMNTRSTDTCTYPTPYNCST